MLANIHKFYHPKAMKGDIRPPFPHENVGEVFIRDGAFIRIR